MTNTDTLRSSVSLQRAPRPCQDQTQLPPLQNKRKPTQTSGQNTLELGLGLCLTGSSLTSTQYFFQFKSTEKITLAKISRNKAL